MWSSGTPPYNNDVYLDFVTLAHQLSSQYTCMITPAKWQAKGGEKNEKFRRDIVPYMSHIVYYPDCSDVFDITSWGGVSYFLLSKNASSNVKMTTKCGNKLVECNSIVVNISDTNRICTMPAVLSIISKATGHGETFKPHYNEDKFVVILKNTFSGSGSSPWRTGVYILSPLEYQASAEPLFANDAPILYSNSEDECKSAISYFSTRLVRFLMLLSVHGQHIFSQVDMTIFRFVPDPGAFDHIFTDEELYQKYNLTPDEINIIESVIKERK